jgi:hypothetical protein
MGDMGEADGEFLRVDAEEDGSVRLDADAPEPLPFLPLAFRSGTVLYYSRVECSVPLIKSIRATYCNQLLLGLTYCQLRFAKCGFNLHMPLC